MLQIQKNLAQNLLSLLSLSILAIGWGMIADRGFADNSSKTHSPIEISMENYQKSLDKGDKASECKLFTIITDKASGAMGTTDLSVALRYTSDLKQDLINLQLADSQLKSLQEKYLQFAKEMEGQLVRVKRDQSQGDYGAVQAAVPTLTATGNRGLELQQTLWQYCGKSE
ncbi:hypothetical protein [Pseudanabaena sp. UWO310]|uniref:hypothetical protein n=1 Tax=Pseudanabaena sp. UWO310 TaxID=2480795 RepID=UPI00115947FB|nr:hypothetical protein [Pseudanabaena sp. UWO310]TYQ28190.1 hypothetical protein PseudUWO310_14295 [Pseudanabaena sp. UWO310]